MLVIVLENVPLRLRGYLSRLLLEVRAGIYIGDYSVKVRERLWCTICDEIGEENAVIAWNASIDIGFEFDISEKNRRIPTELDGIKFVRYMGLESPNS